MSIGHLKKLPIVSEFSKIAVQIVITGEQNRAAQDFSILLS